MEVSSIIHPHFLLASKEAIALYEQFAKDLPIIDYHSHLPADEIAANKQYSNLTEIWLKGDHYKWRAMRALGVEESYITGDRSDEEKFLKWAEVVPNTLRNPLFHWTHMELQNPFGISKYLNPRTAKEIYDEGMLRLQEKAFSSQGILSHFNVKMVGTTDDPIDTLSHHKAIAASDFETKILPSFRPDKIFAIENVETFREYIEQLANVSQVVIRDLNSLCQALQQRIDYFHQVGCRISDYGISTLPTQSNIDEETIDVFLRRILDGGNLMDNQELANAYKFFMLSYLSKAYHQKGWVQQFHLGALRNTNTRLLHELGPDTGFDSIGDYAHGTALASFLNYLDSTDQLTKTIIYNLNPADNALFATMAGNFPGEGVRGKVQFGSAWWYNDQLDGMRDQINTLSNLGVISTFVGMLTDSRSFLSYSRHEYFRRLLCNLFAEDIRKGLIPNDLEWVGKIIADICYHNAKRYFQL